MINILNFNNDIFYNQEILELPKLFSVNILFNYFIDSEFVNFIKEISYSIFNQTQLELFNNNLTKFLNILEFYKKYAAKKDSFFDNLESQDIALLQTLNLNEINIIIENVNQNLEQLVKIKTELKAKLISNINEIIPFEDEKKRNEIELVIDNPMDIINSFKEKKYYSEEPKKINKVKRIYEKIFASLDPYFKQIIFNDNNLGILNNYIVINFIYDELLNFNVFLQKLRDEFTKLHIEVKQEASELSQVIETEKDQLKESHEKLEQPENLKQIQDLEKVEKIDQIEKLEQIKKIEQPLEQIESLIQTEKIEQIEGMEQVEKIKEIESLEQEEKVEQAEKIEQMENLKQIESLEQKEKIEQEEKIEQIENLKEIESLEQEEKVEQAEKIEQIENLKQIESLDQTDKIEQIEKEKQEVKQIEELEQVGELSQTEKLRKIEEINQILGQIENSEHTKKLEQVGESEQIGKVEMIEKLEQIEKFQEFKDINEQQKLEIIDNNQKNKFNLDIDFSIINELEKEEDVIQKIENVNLKDISLNIEEINLNFDIKQELFIKEETATYDFKDQANDIGLDSNYNDISQKEIIKDEIIKEEIVFKDEDNSQKIIEENISFVDNEYSKELDKSGFNKDSNLVNIFEEDSIKKFDNTYKDEVKKINELELSNLLGNDLANIDISNIETTFDLENIIDNKQYEITEEIEQVNAEKTINQEIEQIENLGSISIDSIDSIDFSQVADANPAAINLQKELILNEEESQKQFLSDNKEEQKMNGVDIFNKEILDKELNEIGKVEEIRKIGLPDTKEEIKKEIFYDEKIFEQKDKDILKIDIDEEIFFEEAQKVDVDINLNLDIDSLDLDNINLDDINLDSIGSNDLDEIVNTEISSMEDINIESVEFKEGVELKEDIKQNDLELSKEIKSEVDQFLKQELNLDLIPIKESPIKENEIKLNKNQELDKVSMDIFNIINNPKIDGVAVIKDSNFGDYFSNDSVFKDKNISYLSELYEFIKDINNYYEELENGIIFSWSFKNNIIVIYGKEGLMIGIVKAKLNSINNMLN